MCRRVAGAMRTDHEPEPGGPATQPRRRARDELTAANPRECDIAASSTLNMRGIVRPTAAAPAVLRDRDEMPKPAHGAVRGLETPKPE